MTTSSIAQTDEQAQAAELEAARAEVRVRFLAMIQAVPDQRLIDEYIEARDALLTLVGAL